MLTPLSRTRSRSWLRSSSFGRFGSGTFRKAAEAGLVDWGKAEAASGVGNSRSSGVRVGNGLTPEQAKALLLAPEENTLKKKRDGALLAFLVGCALRRAELVSLVVDKIQMRDGRWVIPDLVGKRKRVRTVPVPGWVKDRLDLWTQAAEIREGKIFRAVLDLTNPQS